MALFSLQDGGLLGEWQEAAADAAEQPAAAAAAVSRGDKALCAVAYAGSCIIVTSPWRQRACAVKGRYVCPEVITLIVCAAPESARACCNLQEAFTTELASHWWFVLQVTQP